MWNDQEEEAKEATWEEYSELYRDFHRTLTVSEHDRAHKSVVFCQEQKVPAAVAPVNAGSNGKSNGSSSTSASGSDQINFLSQFTIVSHQGITNYYGNDGGDNSRHMFDAACLRLVTRLCRTLVTLSHCHRQFATRFTGHQHARARAYRTHRTQTVQLSWHTAPNGWQISL